MRDARAITLAAALAVVAAGCSGSADSDSATTTTPAPESAATTLVGDESGPSIPTTTTIPGFADGPLAEVCPASLVVQTSGLPAASTGPFYSLLGDAPVVDVEQLRVRGTAHTPRWNRRGRHPRAPLGRACRVISQSDRVDGRGSRHRRGAHAAVRGGRRAIGARNDGCDHAHRSFRSGGHRRPGDVPRHRDLR